MRVLTLDLATYNGIGVTHLEPGPTLCLLLRGCPKSRTAEMRAKYIQDGMAQKASKVVGRGKLGLKSKTETSVVSHPSIGAE